MSDPSLRNQAVNSDQGSDDSRASLSNQKLSVNAAAALANPAEQGEWSGVQDIGMYALHAVLRPDGKVMFWYRTAATDADDPLYNTVLWDPISKE